LPLHSSYLPLGVPNGLVITTHKDSLLLHHHSQHLSIDFFLSSFDHGTFEEVATVAYALMVGIFDFETEPKGEIYYYVNANVANKIV
jgi:hypothetical protein